MNNPRCFTNLFRYSSAVNGYDASLPRWGHRNTARTVHSRQNVTCRGESDDALPEIVLPRRPRSHALPGAFSAWEYQNRISIRPGIAMASAWRFFASTYQPKWLRFCRPFRVCSGWIWRR